MSHNEDLVQANHSDLIVNILDRLDALEASGPDARVREPGPGTTHLPVEGKAGKHAARKRIAELEGIVRDLQKGPF